MFKYFPTYQKFKNDGLLRVLVVILVSATVSAPMVAAGPSPAVCLAPVLAIIELVLLALNGVPRACPEPLVDTDALESVSRGPGRDGAATRVVVTVAACTFRQCHEGCQD